MTMKRKILPTSSDLAHKERFLLESVKEETNSSMRLQPLDPAISIPTPYGHGMTLKSAILETCSSRSEAPKMITRSNSIPIRPKMHDPYHSMDRDAELLRLQKEEFVLADHRDYVMFTRIINGIVKQQEGILDYRCRRENDLCLRRVIATRFDRGESFEDDTFYPPDVDLGDSELDKGIGPVPKSPTSTVSLLSLDGAVGDGSAGNYGDEIFAMDWE